MDNLPIVLVIVAAVALLVYALFFRKKALPETAAEKPTVEPRSGERAAAGTDRKQGRQLGPTPKPPTPESIPSTEVLPDESGQVPALIIEATTAAPPVASKKDVAGLRKGLAATRGGFMAKLKALFTGKKEIDPAILEQMEEIMISSDVGVKTTQSILERIREKLQKNELADSDAVWAALRAEATRILDIGATEARSTSKNKPMVVLMVGVNGVGKTTTIGKLATK
jgi:fused signal recognition particle receptor